MSEIHTLHERFDKAAPDGLAVNDLTYREIRDHAEALARGLVASGVRHGDVVGLHLDRSPVAIVAMLAVLKAGAAYLPLPTDYPDDRLRHMVRETDAVLVLSESGYQAEVPVRDPRELADVPGTPLPAVGPEDLAYVIFTSGSTGRPKGVGVTHGGAVNLVAAHQSYVHFGPQETVLQLAPTAFDASAFEIWGALANGARLLLAAPTYHALEELPRCLREEQVTTLLLTPALFHVMVDRHLETLGTVRQLVVGGDAMSAGHAHRYVEHKTAQGEPFLFNNVYGPTEGTTLVSSHPMSEVPADAAVLPLGMAIDGADLYLLAPDLRPVRPGERGEIHIGGRAVARGYLKQPARTAESFLPDPFSSTPGSRMYATGDEGRLRPDGLIEFIGRLDTQVKVRGHRVELAEVEQAILSHPAITAACVLLTDEHLVAHIAGTVAREDLLTYLRTTLPEYMLPAQVVEHPALPLTSSGKVDRRVLADHRVAESPEAAAGEELTPAEEVLAEVWRTVLGVAAVGPSSDFFALGGNSLMAIRVLGAAEDRGLILDLPRLFKNTTLRAVCAGLSLSSAATEQADEDEFALLDSEDLAKVPSSVVSAMPATRLQLDMNLESKTSVQATCVDTVSREISLPLKEDALRRALDDIAQGHPILRTRFDLTTFSLPVQLVEPDAAIPLTVDDHQGMDAVGLIVRHENAMRELAAPFDPEVAPLFRVHAARLGEDRFQLSYAFHHAVLDAWSESVLALELLRGYQAHLAGDQATFAPPAPLAEYVKLERAALANEASREYFRGFADAVIPEADRQERRYQTISLRLPDEHARGLAENVAVHGIPVKSQVFAAFYTAVASLSATREPVVGISVNGRPETTGGDRTLGLFLNRLPVRLAPTDTWLGLARAAQQAEQDLLPHRRFPFSEVRDLLGGSPFEMAFSYTLHARNELVDEGLTTRAEDRRVQSTLPVRVEVISDGQLGFSLEITADENRFGVGFALRVGELIREGISRLATAPDSAPANAN
ncbi:amino acid adenylation domain-containing protein [Pseudonocardiaceae bacterium YIM PH 21723]|nr:amino acid adenylation domain-containing protein [Pseudonocardiaceae bacterium YIM PH 21723]